MSALHRGGSGSGFRYASTCVNHRQVEHPANTTRRKGLRDAQHLRLAAEGALKVRQDRWRRTATAQ